jgi:hypothetical protein
VVQGGQDRVDRGGLLLADHAQVAGVVPHGVVAGVRVGQRIAAVEVGAGQPGEEVGDAGAVGAAGVGGQREPVERGVVGGGQLAGAADADVGGGSGSRVRHRQP